MMRPTVAPLAILRRLLPVVALVVPVAATGQEDAPEEERRQPCFAQPLEDSTEIAVTGDGEYAGAITYERFHVYAGGLGPMGFMSFGGRPIGMAPHPTRSQMAVAVGNVKLVDMATRKSVAEFKPASYYAAWRKGGAQLLGIGYDDNVRTWDVATRKEVAPKWKLPLGKKESARFFEYNDAGGLLALGFDDGRVRVFEADTGREVVTVMAHPVEGELKLNGVSLSTDAKRLATSDFSQIKVWDVATGEMKHRFSTRPGGLARFVRFYAGGKRLAFANPVAGGYGFQFIDAETGDTVGKGPIGSGSIEGWDMAFPDSDDPLIVAIADQVLFWCRYSAVVGLTKGITITGGPPR
jgi:hypothetical protein